MHAYAAIPGHPFDENYSTHLWIFNRVRDMVLNGNVGTPPNLVLSLSDPNFTKGLQQGLYDADNLGDRKPETSGYYYSAHFYNPETGKGGWWDPIDLFPPESPMKNVPRNALDYGLYYFKQSRKDPNPYSSGWSLGLSLHYLEDLCQPMHCGIYPNIPKSLGGF